VGRWRESVNAHDRHFTYAENIYGADCNVPRLDYNWVTTRMPIVTSLWDDDARTAPSPGTPWTTVMSWNAFKGVLTYQGVEYRSKGAEFEKIVALPKTTQVPLLLAVGGITSPFRWLARHGWETAYRALSNLAQRNKFRQLQCFGWRVADGPSKTSAPEQYQEFIAQSRGEVSTAKNVYVAMRTGWFSSRSACYLAAARPVVVQDTGFGKILRCGEGLIAFNTVDEAVGIEADYARHSEAARAVAVEYFDSGKVLARFIDDAMASDSTGRKHFA
jgi:hypothetical protein